MRLSQLFRFRDVRFQVLATGLFAVLLASPVSAQQGRHALDLDVEPDSLAGPQDGTLRSQPQPVYPNGAPEIDTADDADEVTPAKPTIVATIDKSTQTMTVFVDGVEQHSWPVSTGKAGYSTPSGSFTASSMNEIWYSRQWDNTPMPHSVFFTKRGHAIHATKEVKKLGSPASKGCVRLSAKNAKTFFYLVKDAGLENTEVVLTGVTPGGEYKITQPPRDRYPAYGTRYRDGYGYYERPPRQAQRQRRRLFQPYYNSPPRQYRQPRQHRPQQRRRWFFRN